MQKPAIPANEKARMHALDDLDILDTPIERPFERITRMAKTVFNVPIAAFTLIASDRQWFKSIQGLNIQETSRDVSFCGHAINQADVFVVEDAEKDARFCDNPLVTGEPHIRFYAGCPITLDNQHTIGTICIIDTQPRLMKDQEIIMLKDMAELIKVELKSYQNSQNEIKLLNKLNKAKKQALVDELTRVLNRRGIESMLKEKIKQCEQSQTSFGVALIDADNFKQINDHYGHCAGDEVLRNIAKRLLEGYRHTDIIGRWGGEEFLIILDNKTPQEVRVAAERTRQLICNRPIEFEREMIYVTVTTGITLFNGEKPITLTTLIENSDKALYQGKQAGKNKVVEL